KTKSSQTTRPQFETEPGAIKNAPKPPGHGAPPFGLSEPESIADGRRRLHIPPRVDRCVVHANFIVHVRAGGAAADAGVTDDFAALYARSRHCGERRQ